MRRLAGLLCAGLALLLGTGGVAGASAVHPLYEGGAFYPRLIRLAHNGPFNGLVLGSVTSNDGSAGIGVIVASVDGENFQQVAEIRDPAAANGAGICCADLFELPTPLGDLPAGTVLWADTVGYTTPVDQRQVRQRLWASADQGRHWRWLSDFGVSPNHFATWEPGLAMDAAGELVAFYSDETDQDHHNQKLVQVRSSDGVHWRDYRETVVSDQWSVRPGMGNAIALPGHGYLLAYEVCNNDKLHLCSAYVRHSADGWDYGDPRDLGTVVRTMAGRYGRHTPTIALNPDGTVLLATEMLVNADGSLAPGNGRTILANSDFGDGPWRELPAPIAVAGVNNTNCKNFSPSLLPSVDGQSVTEAATDLVGSTCTAYVATAPLA